MKQIKEKKIKTIVLNAASDDTPSTDLKYNILDKTVKWLFIRNEAVLHVGF